MAKSSPTLVGRTRRQAETRFHELVDELKLLLVAFPHLSESFDEDELPISFLLRQQHDQTLSKTSVERPSRLAKRRRGA